MGDRDGFSSGPDASRLATEDPYTRHENKSTDPSAEGRKDWRTIRGRNAARRKAVGRSAYGITSSRHKPLGDEYARSTNHRFLRDADPAFVRVQCFRATSDQGYQSHFERRRARAR